MEVPTESNYIIIGGGLTGCAFASRLAELLGPSSSILILEAGVDPTSNPNSTSLGRGFTLPESKLDWAYKTAPNPALEKRVIMLVAGKTLGSGSVLNYGGWARGDKRDCDAWARIVDGDRWSYKGLLPYFQRSESFHDARANPNQYGSDGPMKWAEFWIEHIPTNTGKLDGLSEFLKNFDDGVRHPSHLAFDLSGVRIVLETIVHRILFEQTPDQKPRATTVVPADDGGLSDNPLAPSVPVDGSFVGTSVMFTLPTYRGSLELASASPNASPVIAGNYFSTALDRAVLVYGARRLLQCLTGTEIGKEFVETEVGPGLRLEPLTVESRDKDIEDRIRIVRNPHFHIAGTCVIGKVLDTNLRVKGIQGLRVVDASIFPAPLRGHS